MSVSSAPPPIHEHYRPELAVNGAGLDAGGLLHATGFNVDTWQVYFDGTPVTHHPGGYEGSCWIAFDLGQVYHLDAMWIWNLNADGYTGRGLRNVYIEYSADGTTWSFLTSAIINQSTYGTGDPYPHETEIACGRVDARYVVITAAISNGNWNNLGIRGLAEVKFFQSQSGPEASLLSPPNSAQEQSRHTILRWAPGDAAVSHDVYFGSDLTAVTQAQRLAGDVNRDGLVDLTDLYLLAQQWLQNPGGPELSADLNHDDRVDNSDFSLLACTWFQSSCYQGNQPLDNTSFDPGCLEFGKTYYWRIDELNDAGDIVPGNVWSFTVEPGDIHVFCGTGDHLWVRDLEPVDSPATINAMFEWMADTYKANRIYWRGGQGHIWDRFYRFGRQTPAPYDWTMWKRHLYNDLMINEAAVTAAHSNGMQIFLYTGLFEHGVQPDVGIISPYLLEDQLRIDHPEWCIVDRWGERRCPGPIAFCYPAARSAVIQRLVNHIINYGYDGVNFYTYVENLGIRYLDEFGFNQPVVNEFNRRYPGVDLHADNLTAEQKLYWYKCRGKFVTDFLRELHSALAAYHKILSVIIDPNNPNYAQPWWGKEIPGTGMIYLDWQGWVDQGIVDELWVQLGDINEQKALLDEMIDYCQGKSIKLTVRTPDPFSSTWDYYVNAGVTPTAVITAPTNGIERITLEATSLSTLYSPDWRLRVQTLDDIASGIIAADGATVAALAGDPHVLVRRKVMYALAALNAVDQVAAVENALILDPESSVRIAAAGALAHINGPNSCQAILQALQTDGYFQFKQACIDALAGIGADTLTALVDALAHSAYQPVREVSARALYRLGTTGMYDSVFQPLCNAMMLQSEDYRVRYWAIDGLVSLRTGFSAAQQQQLIADLTSIIGHETSPTVELHAADALGYMVPYMTAALRYDARTALAQLFAAYGDNCSRSDAAFGWRVVGNALLAFGTDGRDILEGFLHQTDITVTAAPPAIHDHYRPELAVNGAGLDTTGLLHRSGFNVDTWQTAWDGVSTVRHHPGGKEGSCYLAVDLVMCTKSTACGYGT